MEYLNLTPKTIIAILIACVISFLIGRLIEWIAWKRKFNDKLAEKFKSSRRVRAGQAAEQIAPLLPDFPFDPGDCRFIGKPIDYVVFNGSCVGDITEVVFVEVKSGRAKQLNLQEKRLKEMIEKGRVRWVQYDIEA